MDGWLWNDTSHFEKISFLHLSFSSLTTFYDSHDVLIDMDDY